MSIVSLAKVTFLGPTADKEKVLDDLQDLGCLHLIPLAEEGVAPQKGPTPQAREALKFLLTCPQKRRQVRDAAKFDARDVERQALELQRRLLDLYDERDFLKKRIADLLPWGDFTLPPLEELAGQRLWFYLVPHNQMRDVEATDLRWEVVHRDNRFRYVVVLSPEEPEGMPVFRTHTGYKPRHELEDRLEDVELDIEDAEAERVSLTRWCVLYASKLDRLEDREALMYAASLTYDIELLFGLQGWAPRDRLEELQSYAADHGLAFEWADPQPGDDPPTMLHNAPAMAPGEDLVTFYMTPGYFTWDPSMVVLVSFSLFFAMILADAGYAAVLGLILLRYWRPMGESEGGKRFRILFASLVSASLIYGVLAGGYFGVTPDPDSLLGKLWIIDVADASTMMMFSIVIGVVHVVLGNVMDAYRMGKRAAALAPTGWACMTGGGLLLYVAMQGEGEILRTAAIGIMVLGAVLVVLFTGAGSRPLPRAISGIMALTRITNAFGDVMSYLRLFALGLATASLAQAFNDMAMQIKAAQPGLGLLLALLVLLIGHALNFVLGIMSAVVHGLRLNVIEFFNWGLSEEGNLFKPFKKKEGMPWKPSS